MLVRAAGSLLGGHAAARAAPTLAAAALLWPRGYAIEKGPQQTDAPTPRKPFVQEDSQGIKQHQKEQYESMVAQASGVAEDVRMKDAAPTSLGRMDVDQRGPENERVKEARQMAASTEREMEDQELADAVFDDTKSASDTLADTTSSRGMTKGSSTATKPQ